jgi:hypothetical protein
MFNTIGGAGAASRYGSGSATLVSTVVFNVAKKFLAYKGNLRTKDVLYDNSVLFL